MLHHFIENRTLSYIVGLLQSDGHHWAGTGNKGKITLEVRASDRLVLEQLKTLFPTYSSIRERTRDTNFKVGAQSAIWSVYAFEARNALASLGVPSGDKAEVIAPPSFAYSAPDYFRGLVDGDGSLGYTSNGFPFLSLVTKSAAMARSYEGFLHSVTGKMKVTNPNTRDRVYNICVYKEDAQAVASHLYKEAEISLERKHQAYLHVMQWLRPATMKKIEGRRRWTPEEDAYVLLEKDIEVSATVLGRTEKSIRVRRSRLMTSGRCG